MFCIRGLAKYLRSLGYDIFTPELPKAVSSYVPYIFSEPELRDIINASDNLAAKFSGMQAPVLMPLLIRMLYGCGLRLGEAMALRWHDVNLVDGIIKIRYAKNEKQRIVPMHETLTKLCQIYFESYSSVDVQNDYIFKNCKGTPYCQTWIRQLFSQILKSAGIEYMRSEKQERGPCLHCFRHLFVFHSLTNSASNGRCFEDSVPFLSTYLGHNSIMETDKYLRFSYELNHDAHRIVSAYTGNVFPTVEDL